MTLLLLKAVDRQRVNVCSANIPGPRRPLFLGGARVLEVVPILPLIGRVSLGVGAVSYDGAFTIGITADRDAFPDLDTFVGGMRHELSALREVGSEDPRPRVARVASDQRRAERDAWSVDVGQVPITASLGRPTGRVTPRSRR